MIIVNGDKVIEQLEHSILMLQSNMYRHDDGELTEFIKGIIDGKRDVIKMIETGDYDVE